MTKYAAFGTLFKRGAVEVAQVVDISGPNLSADTVDVTSHDSTGGWEEHVVTILRSGDVTLELVWDPNAVTHKNAAGGLLDDLTDKTAVTYSIVFPSSGTVTWEFSAFVVGFAPSAPSSGHLSATVTLKITGQPTLV